MEEITITFANAVNVSLSMGDIVYYNTAAGSVRLGDVASISSDRTQVTVNRNLQVAVPGNTNFIFFTKPVSAEASGIIGYEATVTMTNASTEKAELYAVSSEVFESSR